MANFVYVEKLQVYINLDFLRGVQLEPISGSSKFKATLVDEVADGWLEFEAEKAELDRILEVKTNA